MLAQQELALALDAEDDLFEEASDEELALSYVSLIARTIEDNWSRPPSARNDMEAELILQLIPTGEVVSVSVARGSGNLAFDRSAMNAVKKAERFWGPPMGVEEHDDGGLRLQIHECRPTPVHLVRFTVWDDAVHRVIYEAPQGDPVRNLRWVLLRNPHLQTRFLMTEGDPDLAKMDSKYMPGFPSDVRNIFEYDLIILGDVSSKYFKPGQLELLETQIKEHGGSLIMIGGTLHAPASYQNTPVENILPVNIGVGKPRVVANNVSPQLPTDQALSPITTLLDDPTSNQRVWDRVRPLGRLPVLSGPKPSANVLLELPAQNAGEPPYPLVSWHPYGKGKAMFVASDRLWRLRLEVGDAHHAKFWGQSIQFLAMSRLLGQNKRIALQTERKRYNPGEPVRVYANVLSETYEPVVKDSHTVVIERPGFEDARQELQLIPDPQTPGLYVGTFPAGEEGQYTLGALAHEAEIAGSVEFSVAFDSLEDRDTSAKPELAEAIAEASGGQVVSPVALPGFVDALPSQAMSRVVSREIELWDTPLLYLPLLLFAGLEWYLRRRESLL